MFCSTQKENSFFLKLRFCGVGAQTSKLKYLYIIHTHTLDRLIADMFVCVCHAKKERFVLEFSFAFVYIISESMNKYHRPYIVTQRSLSLCSVPFCNMKPRFSFRSEVFAGFCGNEKRHDQMRLGCMCLSL